MLTTAWRDNSGAIFEVPVFAVGDVHGQAEALRRLLDHISSLVSPEEDAALIQLGDLIDRGPDSLGALELAFGNLPGFRRITHLPGNHELMLLKALRGDPKAQDGEERRGSPVARGNAAAADVGAEQELAEGERHAREQGAGSDIPPGQAHGGQSFEKPRKQ